MPLRIFQIGHSYRNNTNGHANPQSEFAPSNALFAEHSFVCPPFVQRKRFTKREQLSLQFQKSRALRHSSSLQVSWTKRSEGYDDAGLVSSLRSTDSLPCKASRQFCNFTRN